jgi:tRNA nucleotidyltransferase/poly(A) polymerase
MNKIIDLISNAIEDTSFEGNTFIAGGFVRDHFMNRDSKDIDIVVANNGINGGINLANFLHKTLNNTSRPVIFERFGTAQIKIDGQEVEIVATRKESYDLTSRHPEVEFGTIEDDVIRRDFSINSLLFNISNNSFIDLFGGMFDIEKKIIKSSTNPETRMKEDPLRIMRAIRFAAQLGFDIEEETFKAIIKFVPWLNNISNERIRVELEKTLVAKHFIKGVQLLKDTGILGFIIPEFNQVDNIQDQGKWHREIKTKNLWNHTLNVLESSSNTVEARLAALLHDIGKTSTMTISESGDVHFFNHQFVSQRIAINFMRKFKFTNEQIEWVGNSIGMHMNFVDGMLDKTIRKMVSKFGKEQFLFFTDLAMADSVRTERKDIVMNIINFVNTDIPVVTENVKLPVTGDDIMERFNLKPSKKIGELLNLEKEMLFENPNVDVNDIWVMLENNK